MQSIKTILISIVMVLLPFYAQAWPEKNVTIVVPFPPGAFNDTMARSIGAKLSVMHNRPVVVENKPGGNTVIANRMVASLTGDTHTLLVTPFAFATMPSLMKDRLQYDPVKDFTPLIFVGYTQNVVVTRKDLGINDISELVSLAKRNPGKLNFGSSGIGSSQHLSAELLMKMTGTDMVHIPYKGGAPMLAALMAGEIDVAIDNVPNVLPHVRTGKIRAIATTGSSAAPEFPNLPTVSASGLPGYEVLVSFGLQLPGKVSTSIVHAINRDINAILLDPDIVKMYQNQGVQIVGGSPADYAGFIQKEMAKWSELTKSVKIQID